MASRTILDRDRLVAVLDEQFDAVLDLARGLDDHEWDQPTACPGWSVKDNLVHVIGTEAMLLGRPTPEVDLPDDLPHVRNDIGRFNEQWIEAYRDRTPAEVVADLDEVIAARRAELADKDQAAFDAESFTPAGTDTYGRFMRIRVMDMWMHEQDIREAVGRPGHDDGSAAVTALDEMSGAMGFVVGKRAGAPAGSSVRLDLTGSSGRRIDVEVGERASVVPALDGPPTATLTMPVLLFTRLAGGRGADPAGVEVDGDAALGRAVVDNLGFMI
jgi:uncharacterized protein (TIGR03083 family)